jgi:hypothetical protein
MHVANRSPHVKPENSQRLCPETRPARQRRRPGALAVAPRFSKGVKVDPSPEAERVPGPRIERVPKRSIRRESDSTVTDGTRTC